MLDYVYGFFKALVLSVFIESLVVLFLCRLFEKDKRISLLAILGTLCTIPYVWFVFPTLFWHSSGLIIYFGEGFAFLIEAILYKTLGKLNWKKALIFSLIANIASYGIGKLINTI